VTREDGTWSLRVREVKECWVGALAPGRRAAWLDGTSLDPAADLVHTLPSSPTLWVRVVREDGTPHPECALEVVPWPQLQHYELPAPGFREGPSWAVTDADGRAPLQFATEGPVLVRPQPEGYVATPETGWVTAEADAFEFRLLRACTLDLCVEEGERGTAPTVPLTIEFHPRPRGAPVTSATLLLEQGMGCVRDRIRPGRYDLLVHGPGFEPSLALDVAFDAPGTAREVTVTLARGREPVWLRVAADPGAPAPGDAVLVFGRALEGPLSTLGWRPLATRRTSGALEVEASPGRWDLLLASPPARRVALASGVEVSPEGAGAVEARWERGVRVDFAETAQRPGDLRRIRVESDALGALPVYGLGTSRRPRLEDELVNLLGDPAGGGATLGPYPGESVRLRLERWGGDPLVREVGR
jgi:hypothetical protein